MKRARKDQACAYTVGSDYVEALYPGAADRVESNLILVAGATVAARLVSFLVLYFKEPPLH